MQIRGQATWWARVRAGRWWWQATALAVAVALVWVAAAASENGGATDPERTATARGRVGPPASTPPPSSVAGLPGEDGDPTAVLAGLRVAPEGPRAGYGRDRFGSWVDADGDRCNTREEVLIAESTSPAQVDPYGCTVVAGDWVSLYDGLATGDPAELDVDHVVALAEAWDSGASSWDEARRTAFANDLEHPQALRAVSAASNRSKSDSDPAGWRPPRPGAWCEFARDWVAVKLAWDLTADEAEVAALGELLGTCQGGAPVSPPPATTAPPPLPAGTALGFTAMQCDAPGSPDAAGNANEEWVALTNAGPPADLSGWTIADEAGNTYAFPAGFTLGTGASVTLHTGTGADTGGDLYWGRAQHVWNNGGDTAFLEDAGGGVVASRSC